MLNVINFPSFFIIFRHALNPASFPEASTTISNSSPFVTSSDLSPDFSKIHIL